MSRLRIRNQVDQLEANFKSMLTSNIAAMNLTGNNKRKSSLDIIFDSVDSTNSVKGRHYNDTDVRYMESLDDITEYIVSKLTRKHIRTIIPIGLDSWGSTVLHQQLQNSIGKLKTISADL